MKGRGSLSTELDQGHKKVSKLSMGLFRFKTKILPSPCPLCPSRLRT